MSRLSGVGFVSTVAGAVLLLGGLASSSVTAVGSPGVPHQKVTICHATWAEPNPYREEDVSVRSVDGRYTTDHSHHTGPVWYEGAKDDRVEWGDIIPPLFDGDAGLNWTTAGRAILANGCAIPPVVTTTTVIDTTTTVVDTTTTVIDTTTTVIDTTTTTAPDGSTTSIESGGPTTTVTDGSTTSIQSGGPTTTVDFESGGPTTTPGTMPATGSRSESLVVLGLGMVGFGVLARLIGRRGANA